MQQRLPKASVCHSHQAAFLLTLHARLAARRSPASQDFSSVQRKLVFTTLFPVTWAWLTTAVLQWRPRAALLLYCACWCLTGYIAAHRFCP